MKVITVLGTRPEIIRLSRIIPLLDRVCTHKLIHTGQNFDKNLSDIFFDELNIRKPDYYLSVKASSVGEQIGKILSDCEKVFESEKPDKILILGDTNSALCAIIAKRMGIPVYHMEAGNRCFDDRVPEEVNRRIIDHSSNILMPYTERSRDNLLREGIHTSRIFVTGNPIREVINEYISSIDESKICNQLEIKKAQYFLITLHRAENVDLPVRLERFLTAFSQISQHYNIPVLISLHPRTRSKITSNNLTISKEIRFIDPPGFFDFVHLEKNAKAVLSDSGTVQEEGCILGIPTVTLRDVTERPETIECGSNILSGSDVSDIIRSLEISLSQKPWKVPLEYLENNVSRTVVNILLGYCQPAQKSITR